MRDEAQDVVTTADHLWIWLFLEALWAGNAVVDMEVCGRGQYLLSRVEVDVDGVQEPWLLMFKMKPNHPTEN